MFELPVIVQLNPDPSTPAIQHISQTYNISVAFKQRSRLYGATGVVRGLQNNVAAVKVGITQTFRNIYNTTCCTNYSCDALIKGAMEAPISNVSNVQVTPKTF